MVSKFNKILLIVTIVVAAFAALYVYKRGSTPHPVNPSTAVTLNNPDDHPDVKDTTTSLPESLLIQVPFTAQAPTANWDELHNEACEEASAIMANAYYNKVKSLPADAVEAEITKLTEWQDGNQGYHLDQTSSEVAYMIGSVYNLKAEPQPLLEADIKKALAENKLVLMSFNGQLLKNPHFKQPGPIHHMLVITGYTKDGKYITNDPGTKFGENYEYDYQTLYDAAADWDHDKNTVNTSSKKMIIVYK